METSQHRRKHLFEKERKLYKVLLSVFKMMRD